jgi:hypothetical protein
MASTKKNHQTHSSDAGFQSNSTWTQRRARSKTEWAGVSMGSAFNPGVDYYTRLEAQRRFYRTCRQVQRSAAKAAKAEASQPEVKPQIGPCYTTYPWTLATYAAIGLTAFLGFRALAPQQILVTRLKTYLKNPAAADRVSADPEVYRSLASGVAKAVQNRLLLKALSQTPDMEHVETYRLFSACRQNLRFRTLPEIVEAVVIYGDVLPARKNLEIHEVTRELFERIEGASREYFRALETADLHKLIMLGEGWVRDLMVALAPHLPQREDKPQQRKSPASGSEGQALSRLGKPQPCADPPETFGPLDGPAPPLLTNPREFTDLASFANRRIPPEVRAELERTRSLDATELNFLKMISGNSEGNELRARPHQSGRKAAEILNAFVQALREAGGQGMQSESMRSDLLEEMLRVGAFEASPLQGNPIDGHEVSIRLANNQEVGASIYDRPVELRNDDQAYRRLLSQAEPITRELQRVLYPNVEKTPETTRLCASGAIDAARLPVAAFSTSVFKRARIQERPDRRGRPLLLLVCDGSGSLGHRPMWMTKVLAASWLASTAKTDIQVLAALYHSGPISRGTSGPLIEWIYHPEKTAATNRNDAVRAVSALPDKGSGGQADAPSLQFLMDEAERLSRGRSIYLVLISDTQWVRSIGGESGYAEVRAVLEEHIERLEERLHVTLVALGVKRETGFENVVDAVVSVSDKEIAHTSAVAKKIALYVAGCMRERRKLVDKPR